MELMDLVVPEGFLSEWTSNVFFFFTYHISIAINYFSDLTEILMLVKYQYHSTAGSQCLLSLEKQISQKSTNAWISKISI